jgi:type II secretion system protein H
MRWLPSAIPDPAPVAAGVPTTRRSGGFTLLELMVVMTIIGIIAGMVALRIGDSSRQVRHEREARRLQQAVQLAAQEAIVRGRAYGLRVGANDYAFCRREAGVWRPIAADNKLGPYLLPGNLQLRVDSTLPEQDERDSDEEGACPMIRLSPSGEMEPIKIAVIEATGNSIIDIDISVTGKVSRKLRVAEADNQ